MVVVMEAIQREPKEHAAVNSLSLCNYQTVQIKLSR